MTTASPTRAATTPRLATADRQGTAELFPVRYVTGTCRSTWPARWLCDGGSELTHAVEVHRASDELTGEPELAVCAAIVAVTALPWRDDDPAEVAAPTRCARCRTLVRAATEPLSVSGMLPAC